MLIENEDSTLTMERVDNSLVPHGGQLVDRVVTDKARADNLVDKCSAVLRIRGQTAREIVNIAYGFFSPLTGFMNKKDLDGVCTHTALASGLVWSIPILLDVSADKARRLGAKTGDHLLLEYHNTPFAVLQVSDIYSYDVNRITRAIYDIDNVDHPGIKMYHMLGDTFIGGDIWLINPPVFHDPYARYFIPPKLMHQKLQQMHWRRTVAFHTSTVPHMGHEWLMKAAWFQHQADGILVSCSVGSKRMGDCIDETVLLGHHELERAGYFKQKKHLISLFLWDRRYAAGKEAVLHAIVRKNLGCTAHVFGKNHAHPPGFGDSWAAHHVFKDLPDLGIESVQSKKWYYCAKCGGITYSGFCAHREGHEEFKSESVCSLLSSGIKPPDHLLRPEVFQAVIAAADKYGFGDGYVTDQYLQGRNPIFTLNKF